MTLYFQSRRKKETEKWPNQFTKILMIAVLRVSIFSYFLQLNRVSKKGKSIDYHPITPLLDGGPIEFKVSGSGKEFLDLAQSYLYLKVKVSKADGTNLDGASKVGFANYPIASLFNQVDVILGGKLISSATNTYAQRSTLEVLLNYDKEEAESQLGCGLFCKDTAGQMEQMDITADPVLNTGLGTRSEWTKMSKIVELQERREGFTQTYLIEKNLF